MVNKKLEIFTKFFVSFIVLIALFFLVAAYEFFWIFWLWSQDGPYEASRYTKELNSSISYSRKTFPNNEIQLYYEDNYPIICLSEKQNCFLLEKLKNKKLYNFKLVYGFFGRTIMATEEETPSIKISKDYLKREIVAIEFSMDGSSAYYYIPFKK